MKTIESLIVDLDRLNVKLRLEDGRLQCSAPKDVMTGELRAELKARKTDIVAFLRNARNAGDENARIKRVSRETPPPLSFSQQRLWFLDRLEPGSKVYNIPVALRLQGPLRVEGLERSLNRIARRHEVLRTGFGLADGVPFQRIHPPADLPLTVLDLAGLTAGGRDRELSRLKDLEPVLPFDLERGPLYRVNLLRLRGTDHVLLNTMHHIVSDGWSMGILIRELAAFYEGGQDDVPVGLPELPVQYADYAHWQRRQLHQELLASRLAYWRARLAGAPGLLRLPTDRPRPAMQSFRGDELGFDLDRELAARLKKRVSRTGASLFVILEAAFSLLLARYSGQRDISVGTPVANRNLKEIEPLIGFFVNTVVLRGDLSGDPTFTELVERTQAISMAAFANQDIPFERVVDALQPERNYSHSPLFQVMFILQNAPVEDLTLRGLQLSQLKSETGTAKFDLTLSMQESGGTLGGFFEFNSDLFDKATIQTLARRFQTLLGQVAAESERRLSMFSLMTPDERKRVLSEWNPAQTGPMPEGSIHAAFEAQAVKSPERVAFLQAAVSAAPVSDCADRAPYPQCLTFAALNARAERWALRLRGLGVGSESVVAVAVPRCVPMAAGLLGILKAGAAYLPLDTTYPLDRLRFMVADSGTRVLLGTAETASAFSDRALEILFLEDGDRGETGGEPPVKRMEPNRAAYLIYTSGSTGLPKGVAGTHGATLNRFRWMRSAFPFTAADMGCQKTALSFVDSIWECFGFALAGVPAVVVPDLALRDPQLLVRTLSETRVTRLTLVPSLLRVLLENVSQPASRLPHLKFWTASGEALPEPLYRRFRRLFPEAVLVNLYGSSELAADATCWEPGTGEFSGHVPIGKPIRNTQTYLRDEHGQLVPTGIDGALFVGGHCLARCYRGRPGLTASRFVPNPFASEPGARLYRTGDRARFRPDGNLLYAGRADAQIKLRGFRIELGEIETVLGLHAEVDAAAVVLKADDAGNGDGRLVAYVQNPKYASMEESRSLGESLRAYLAERLPRYMIPSAFMVLPELPLTANGKLDRNALPAVETATGPERKGEVEPRTEVERRIAGVWRELLEVEEVGIHDNFFELGGHSLMLVRVHAKLAPFFEKELTVVELFQYPTIGALAAHLSGEREDCESAERGKSRAIQRQRQRAGEETGGIAIIGMVGRFPGAGDIDRFWQNLRDGVESVTFWSEEELLESGVNPYLLKNPNYVRAKAILDGIEFFDAPFFGMTPREAETMDPQHRLFLECAWQTIEHAGYDVERYPGSIGVFAGVGINTYLHENLLTNPHLLAKVNWFQGMINNDKDFLPTRVSYKLNLRGPSVNVQTACSTSLVAAHLACQSLETGECDIALAGGVTINARQKAGYLYEEEMVFSPDGHCRAFDARSQGTFFGSGVGLVALKPLARALADGDTVHAVIKGSAINNDGSKKVGFTAPSVDGQAEVIAEALAVSGVAPETIGYVEAHGTGTALGDPIEIEGLTQAYAPYGVPKGNCAVGSVKTNIGHLDTAAGVASLIKTVQALKHGAIPPSLHYENPNPRIDFGKGPFYVNARLSEWRPQDAPRRAGVSSFGIGGTNAHMILEQAPPTEAAEDAEGPHLLLLSAKTPRALDDACGNLAEYLPAHAELPMADIAYTLQTGRAAFPYRRMLVARDHEDAAAALESLNPKRVSAALARQRPEVMFLFPGGGVQYPGMGLDLYRGESVYREAIDACAELAEPLIRGDLRTLLYPARGEEARARRDINVLSLMFVTVFATSYALARLFQSWGIRPKGMTGHSLGEFTAACLAEVFSLEDALAMIVYRARLMEASPEGSMMGVILAESELLPFLGPGLELAAVNSPSHCVVSGETEAIRALQATLEAREISCRRLRIRGAGHSFVFDPLVPKFTEFVSRFELKPPKIPFISNTTGTWISDGQATDPGYWGHQLRKTVRFQDGLRPFFEHGDAVLLEVGPGQVLTTFARQHPDRAKTQVALSSMRHPQDPVSDTAVALETLGKLWLAGVAVDWSALHGTERRRRVPLPTYPFEKRRYWINPSKRALAAREEMFSAKKPNMADWFYVPAWHFAPLSRTSAEPSAQPEPVLVFLDDTGLGKGLADHFRERARPLVTVSAGTAFQALEDGGFSLDPEDEDQYRQLFAALEERDLVPDLVLHLWSVSGAEAESARKASIADRVARFDRAQSLGFYSLIFLAKALAKYHLKESCRILAFSDGMQAVNPADPVFPEKATLAAACIVMAQENPKLYCRSIDLMPAGCGRGADPKLLSRLIEEIESDAPDVTVAYRDHRRLIQAFQPVRLREPEGLPPRLREGGVYLITGGLGSVGLTLATYLAEKAGARLGLVSRSTFPPPESWASLLADKAADDETLRKIEQLQTIRDRGGEPMLLRADVSDRDEMREAVARLEKRFGPVNGVIHGAGVVRGPSFNVIEELTREQSELQFRAKVRGLFVLERLFRDRPLDFCFTISSLGSLLGGLAHAPYTAANLFADRFVHRFNQDSRTIWTSIGWDFWKFVDEASFAGSLGADLLAGAIDPEEGARAFGFLQSSAEASQIFVSARDLQTRVDQWVGRKDSGEEVEQESEESGYERPFLENPFVEPRNETETKIAEIWKSLLGIGQIGAYDNFFELGGDSLLATRVFSRLRETFEVPLLLSNLFREPTVAGLAEVIETVRAGDGSSREAAPDPEEREVGRL